MWLRSTAVFHKAHLWAQRCSSHTSRIWTKSLPYITSVMTALLTTLSYTDAPLPQARTVADKLQRCIVDVADWCESRKLQLNPAKTELMWFGSSTSLQSLSSLDIVVGEDIIQPPNSVRNLGVQFDYDMKMRAQIAKTTQTCFSTYDVYARFEEFWDVRWQHNWFQHLYSLVSTTAILDCHSQALRHYSEF